MVFAKLRLEKCGDGIFLTGIKRKKGRALSD
jgi:hypothetical protein